MNVHELLTKVVPLINDELVHINYGGCGWFAHALTTVLADKGITSDIVLVSHAGYSAHNVSALLRRLKVDDINEAYRIMFSGDYTGHADPCFGHIGVSVGDMLYDCDGVLSGYVISEPIERDVMDLALRGSNTRWNSTFGSCNNGTEAASATITKFLINTFNCEVTS